MKYLIVQQKTKFSNILLQIQLENILTVLETLVDQYNNTVHSSIKMTPVEASLSKNEDKVFRNLYPDFGGKTPTPKLLVGDNVIITKKQNCLRRVSHLAGLKRCLEFLKLF